MKFFKILFVLALLLVNYGIFAQSNKKADDLLVEAKKQFSNKNYSAAVKTANQVLATNPESKDAHLILADVYEKLDSTDLEIFHLNKAGELGREWEVVFRLGEAYFKKGDFPEALRYYNIYSDYKNISVKQQFLLACKMANCKFEMYSINNTGQLNSGNGEYWPTVSADGKKVVFNRTSNASNKPANTEVYMALPDSVMWQIARPVNDSIVFDNVGIQRLGEGERILFFSACNRPDGMGDCDIYFLRFEDGKWGNPLNAGTLVNSSQWEGQPTFSTESRFLYFSSDRTGGNGKKDIWRAELTGFSDDGQPQWKAPENLGSIINTPGNEISPFMYDDKHYFFFASDGHPGMGGMDLFAADADNQGNLLNLRNLGYPINTHYDDDALTLNYICDTTYFSSSRQTEKGMEIFAFNLDRGLATTPVAYVRVKVKDMVSKKPVKVEVKLESQPFKPNRFQSQETDDNGEAMFFVMLNRNYAFTVAEPGYLYTSKFVNQNKANSISEPEIVEIELQPIEIGAEVQLYNIYFETDSFRILQQSESELQNVVAFLKNNTKLKIEIQGHTDSSGNAENNKLLSENRAKSVVDYLVKNGIAKNRLTFKGYGDKVPIASNETPEGRMLNRRTTIKILE
ncbi:MAG TPA: OmpA family protein [Draconibacterium sp.]|nr:OmpA family protein [Draconibacterium sp.]